MCGAQGCLDAEASGAAIESITGRPLTEPTYEIMQRTEQRLVGRATATVCNTLDLTLVVVGGTIARNFAATFFHSAQAELEEHAKLPYSRGARPAPVAPRRQRPADRCRRLRLATDPATPSARAEPGVAGRFQPPKGAVDALEGSDAEAPLRHGENTMATTQKPMAKRRATSSPGRADPAEPVDDEVEHGDVGDVQREGHLARPAEGIEGAGKTIPPASRRRHSRRVQSPSTLQTYSPPRSNGSVGRRAPSFWNHVVTAERTIVATVKRATRCRDVGRSPAIGRQTAAQHDAGAQERQPRQQGMGPVDRHVEHVAADRHLPGGGEGRTACRGRRRFHGSATSGSSTSEQTVADGDDPP